ncbi:hypothetical protein [Pedosphaera parvula]|uniref:Uncharacterized protein n=1 Tax=Pedosphaera parvula (strain Ellin514) TaxID=320771 RepID=B9XG12_PEDPL|nr:hypothetical protein [Pedosphaera parvula]EEF61174.1 hypothetical protein Cflav_PD3891 [Pedosphaera parvula Ellin514]
MTDDSLNIMADKHDNVPKDLLAATNPFSVHRKFHVLRWAIMVGMIFCVGFGFLLYYLNSLSRL